MNTLNKGILWFDNSTKNLSEKIADVAKYYFEKYHIKPTICFVNPQMQAQKSIVDGVEIRPYRCVLPGYLWIGVKDE
jgi:hypothetical protein